MRAGRGGEGAPSGHLRVPVRGRAPHPPRAGAQSGGSSAASSSDALSLLAPRRPLTPPPSSPPQIHIQAERWDDASSEAAEGLRVLLDWGTPWDKRMSFHAWVAWARVLLSSAASKAWPAGENPLGMINLGMVG